MSDIGVLNNSNHFSFVNSASGEKSSIAISQAAKPLRFFNAASGDKSVIGFPEIHKFSKFTAASMPVKSLMSLLLALRVVNVAISSSVIGTVASSFPRVSTIAARSFRSGIVTSKVFSYSRTVLLKVRNLLSDCW